MEYSFIVLLCLFISCFIVGFSKTSVGGLGILAVPIMVYAFGAKAALGVFLPIIVFADIFTVWIYRGLCNWQVVFRLLPSTIIGVVMGFLLIDIVPDSWFTLLIGCLVILMLAASFYSHKLMHLNTSRSYGGVLGVFVGLTSIIANSSGTLVGMYFLQQDLEKRAFVSTRNHFFVILNSMKIPFIASLGYINTSTLMLNVMFIPAVLIGSWLGLKLINVIDMKALKRFVQAAALIAGVKLIYSGAMDIIFQHA